MVKKLKLINLYRHHKDILKKKVVIYMLKIFHQILIKNKLKSSYKNILKLLVKLFLKVSFKIKIKINFMHLLRMKILKTHNKLLKK